MFNCMEDNIPFDDMQTTHVTLFKPARLEMGGFDHILPCDTKGKSVKINRGPFKIKGITACRFSKGMPQLLSYQFETDRNVSKDSMVSSDKQSVSISETIEKDDVMAHHSESVVIDNESRITRDNAHGDKQSVSLSDVIKKDDNESVTIMI